MDEASGLDDDDDSIGGRCVVSDVDDSERAVVRDLLVPLMIMMLALHRPTERIAVTLGSIIHVAE